MLVKSPGASLLLARPLPARRVSKSVRRRLCQRVHALWTPPWGGSDNETDDEIFTAAAVSGHSSRAAGQRHVKQSVPPPGGDEPLPRQTLPAFAVALTFITLGAFFVGSAIRRYILQPADLPDGIANPGSKAKRRGGSGGGKGGRGAGPSVPSVRDLLAQHGQTAEAPGSADPAPPLAAADASQVQTAAAVAAAAGAPSAQGAAAAAAAEAEAAAGPASASEAGTAVETLAGAVPAAAAEQAASGEGEGEGGAIPAEEWCSSILEPALQAATAAKRAEQEEAAAAAAAAKAAALQEAEAVAAAARLAADRQAAAAAAAPLLGAGEVWALSQQGPDGAVLLRLLFPVPGGGEERCVALFQDGRDAQAVQRLLRSVLGLPTVLQQLPADGLLMGAAAAGWGLAFFPAEPPAAAALAAAEAAAAPQLAAGEEAGEDRTAEAAEALFGALQGQGRVLGGDDVRGAAASLATRASADPPPAQQGGEPTQPDEAGQQADAAEQAVQPSAADQPAGAEPAAVQQPAVQGSSEKQQEGQVPQDMPSQPPTPATLAAAAATGEWEQPPASHVQAPEQAGGGGEGQGAGQRAEAPPAQPAAAAGQQTQRAQRAVDPWWEEQTRRRSPAELDPGWWRALPVLHVAQLSYGDGAKGLMSIPICVPTPPAAASGSNAADSAHADVASGGVNSGSSGGGGTVCERWLVAFADLADAQGLAGCPIAETEQGVSQVAVLSVPPATLAAHAETNGCAVAVLPRGELALPRGADYAAAVARVVDAVERRHYEEVLHRAYAQLLDKAAAAAAAGAASGAAAAVPEVEAQPAQKPAQQEEQQQQQQ